MLTLHEFRELTKDMDGDIEVTAMGATVMVVVRQGNYLTLDESDEPFDSKDIVFQNWGDSPAAFRTYAVGRPLIIGYGESAS